MFPRCSDADIFVCVSSFLTTRVTDVWCNQSSTTKDKIQNPPPDRYAGNHSTGLPFCVFIVFHKKVKDAKRSHTACKAWSDVCCLWLFSCYDSIVAQLSKRLCGPQSQKYLLSGPV